MLESISTACYIYNEPLDQKDGRVTLLAESWRDKKPKISKATKISMPIDLYLDCLNVSKDENVILGFTTVDDWKALLSVFSCAEFCFLVDKDFELMLEGEKDMITIKEF